MIKVFFLFVDPKGDGLPVVHEDAAAVWPVATGTGAQHRRSVRMVEEQVIVGQGLLFLARHATGLQGIGIGAQKWEVLALQASQRVPFSSMFNDFQSFSGLRARFSRSTGLPPSKRSPPRAVLPAFGAATLGSRASPRSSRAAAGGKRKPSRLLQSLRTRLESHLEAETLQEITSDAATFQAPLPMLFFFLFFIFFL